MVHIAKLEWPAEQPHEHLHSTFALEMLTQIAGALGQHDFAKAMQIVFGEDFTHAACARLWASLTMGELVNPPIVLAESLGYEADYDNRERVIRLDRRFFLSITQQSNGYWRLASLLLHEFGHHIDNVLRRDFSDQTLDDGYLTTADAPHEEGHRFTAWVAEWRTPLQDHVQIASYVGGNDPDSYREYSASWRQLSARLRAFQRGIDDTVGSAHRLDDREAFEAGSEEAQGHTHQTIGWVLREVGFTREETDAVYFGNWLRDYSQIVDPKITRGVDMSKAFPAYVSRQAWTDLVDILAVRKFPDLRMRYPQDMRVTLDKLGVYRPNEHIDNPMAIDPAFPDPKVRDPDFAPWVLPGDPVLTADPVTSMKRYITGAVEYMQRQLRLAMTEQRSLTGLRSFGAALHVLEDLFAHSNFAELSLISIGHRGVLPWTTPANVRRNLPLVTGTFGGSDVVGSLAAPLGKILFSTQELEFELSQPGYRSERDKVMLLLLSEHPNQNFVTSFQALLAARDGLVSLARKAGVDTLRFYRWLIKTPAAALLNAYNSTAQGVLTWVGNSVADAQLALGSDPNLDSSVEPSHSQLSKDHPEHPLHDLSARLASVAVRQVAQAMVDHWNGKQGDDPIAVATAFFCHPDDTQWHQTLVKSWAEDNPDQVQRAQSRSDLDDVHQQSIRELQNVHSRLLADSNAYLDYVFSDNELPSSALAWVERAFMKAMGNTAWFKELQNLSK